MVDTAFIARLGTEPLAALGVGTTVLSSIFWIFNFLGIGAQTEVAQAAGRRESSHAGRINTLALLLAVVAGVLIILIGVPLSPAISVALGATGVLKQHATEYVNIRWYGAPAVLLTMTAFGTLRGLQEMRIPLVVAVGVNVLNIILDFILIFGYGFIPPMGISGAAAASVISQWIGAIWAVWAVFGRLGVSRAFNMKDTRRLLQIGGDLFVRTGLLNLFLIFTTRAATRIGAESGAAHQAIRQVWLFSTLVLDAYAISGQSLVAYFYSPERLHIARRVASVVCKWSVVTGVVLGATMWVATDFVVALLLPPAAVSVFYWPWVLVVILQPINALAFATDGVHWGTGDFRYLRNAVLVATAVGTLGIYLVDESHADALTAVWAVSAIWITIRAAFGVVRIWPGLGRSPLSLSQTTISRPPD